MIWHMLLICWLAELIVCNCSEAVCLCVPH